MCIRDSYYYAAKLNSTMEDIDLNLEDFVARVNSDLVGKYLSLIHIFNLAVQHNRRGKGKIFLR